MSGLSLNSLFVLLLLLDLLVLALDVEFTGIGILLRRGVRRNGDGVGGRWGCLANRRLLASCSFVAVLSSTMGALSLFFSEGRSFAC